MQYNRCGASGLKLPMVSLGFWHNFGDTGHYDNMKAMCRTAFDNGITHFDLANNYGPAYGSAERNLGQILRDDFFCVPGRASNQHQSRLRYVAGTLRQLGQPQVPHRKPGRQLKAPGAGLCGYFLSSPHGSRDTARRDDGRSRFHCQKAERRSMSVCPTMTVRHWNVHVRF